MQFPQSFVWGAATSAYQIEGAVAADGRGESIWDRFCRVPGKVKGGHSGDVACDHYHRYEQDLDLLQQLGVQSYRFSIAWPRVIPEGRGPVNEKGLDFYRRLVEGLQRRGIRPLVTLYHWDLPQALQDGGGWLNRDTALRFAEYAAVVGRALGGLVMDWITHNEPWVVAFLGHALGVHAPGMADWGAAVRVAHHLLLSHGLAVQALRAVVPGGRVGITLNLIPVYPASDSPEDRAAAWRMDGYHNRWFLDPVLKGAYPEDLLAEYGRRWGFGAPDPADLQVICQPIDFLGVNFYSCLRVRARQGAAPLDAEGLPPAGPVTDMGWEICPQALTELLVRLRADYGPVPIYITENGAAFADGVGTDGRIRDRDRIGYLRDHLVALWRALQAGVDVRGYYAWSLLDNFEWAEGYTKRFGLVYVDYATQRRIPKDSFFWFREVVRSNRVIGDG